MFKSQRKLTLVNVLFALSLVASLVAFPSLQAGATAALPNMRVTLVANNTTYYSATIFAQKPLYFRAIVKNTGNVPLAVTANLTVPSGWGVAQEKFSDCPDQLAVRSSCTISWYFTPFDAGQVYLRVYVRGAYTDSAGNARRITQSPVFIFNVKPAR